MTLLPSAHQGRDTADRDDGSALRCLAGHLVCDRLSDEEGAVQVDVLDAPPEVVREVQEGMEGADTGVRDQDIDAREG